MKIDVRDLGADRLSLSVHKFQDPKGVGKHNSEEDIDYLLETIPAVIGRLRNGE